MTFQDFLSITFYFSIITVSINVIDTFWEIKWNKEMLIIGMSQGASDNDLQYIQHFKMIRFRCIFTPTIICILKFCRNTCKVLSHYSMINWQHEHHQHKWVTVPVGNVEWREFDFRFLCTSETENKILRFLLQMLQKFTLKLGRICECC